MPVRKRLLAAGALVALLLALPSVAAAVECALCGKPIEGQYVFYESLGWNVCRDCAAAPPCEGCRLPRAGRLEGEGGYCSRCVADADGCAACGRPILGRYWTIRGVDGKFCERCRQEAPECASCKAPVLDGRMVDGRLFCRSCRPQLVADVDVYQSLYRQVAERARNVLGLKVERLPELVVEGKTGLSTQRTTDRGGHDVCGLYVRDGRGTAKIHLLSHLTEVRATAVIAHELAHAWQAEQCPEDQGLRIREGFAEWVAWKVLEGMPGTDGERSVIEGRTDEYGRGFHVFADAEARHGTDHAIWYAKSARLR